ncbi:3632_t:CDS:2 [Ambispora leptoticha]|uniref:3632_t:CDS:1 n=1 Tax=Ambispora leptoticha TaxID=144679 RepID=A0A9N9F7J9_9GLOM|nr:3632_t:CDS:2 [Ambispora leptoticha]
MISLTVRVLHLSYKSQKPRFRRKDVFFSTTSRFSRNESNKILFGWGDLGSLYSENTINKNEENDVHIFKTPKILGIEQTVGTELSDSIEKENVKVTKISAGWGHSLIAFEQGEKNFVFSMGLNNSGQLGHEKIAKKGYHRGLVKGLPKNKKINMLACGRLHSFILMSNNDEENNATTKTELYGFGDCMYGQLGTGKDKKDRPITTDSSLPTMAVSCEPSPRHIDTFEEHENVKQVTCGLDHTVILTNENRLYSMGWGADGQLGLGNNSTVDKSVPSKITKLSDKDGERIRKVVSSTDYTMALLENGTLWTWGNSEYGQCMTGAKVDRILEPIQVPTKDYIVDVASGGPFDQGQVFVCGYGPLGLGDSHVEQLTPTRIPRFGEEDSKGIGENIVAIFSGIDYAAAISESRNLYTWGFNGTLGLLGHGHNHTKHQFIPKKVKFPEPVNVETLACGGRNVLALCSL